MQHVNRTKVHNNGEKDEKLKGAAKSHP